MAASNRSPCFVWRKERSYLRGKSSRSSQPRNDLCAFCIITVVSRLCEGVVSRLCEGVVLFEALFVVAVLWSEGSIKEKLVQILTATSTHAARLGLYVFVYKIVFNGVLDFNGP